MISSFDRACIGKIVGGHGDWFGAHLIRLIAKADSQNIERIRAGFPDYVAAFEQWERGSLNEQGARMDVTERPDRFEQ